MPGKTLNLSKDDALQKLVDACREKYVYLDCMMPTRPDCVRDMKSSYHYDSEALINIDQGQTFLLCHPLQPSKPLSATSFWK